MRTGLRIGLIIGFGVALVQLAEAAQTNPVVPNVATNAPKLSPEEMKHNMSYAIGTDIGNNLKKGGVDLDIEVLMGAMKDAMAGKPSQLADPQVREAINNYRQAARAKQEETRRQAAEKNKKEGATFLAENKKKPDIDRKSTRLNS